MESNQFSRRSFLKAALGATAAGVISSCVPMATQVATQSPSTQGAAELSGKVVAWGWDPNDMAYKSVIPSFQAKYPKATVESVNVPWDEIHPKLTAAIEAGMGGPDLSIVEGYFAPRFSGKGILELTDRLNPYRDKLVSAKLAEVESDGKLWGVPWDHPPAAIMYRSDLLEEAGINEIPRTWEAFLTELGPALAREGERYLFAIDPATAPTFYWYRPLLYQIGSGYYDKDGNILLGDEKSVHVLQWMVDAIHKYKVAMTGVGYFEGPSWWSAVKDGKIASMFVAPYMAGMMKTQVPEMAGMWKLAPLPVWEGETLDTTLLGGASVVIPDQSKNPELTWKFVEHLQLTVEGNVTVYKNFGIFPSYLPAFEDPVFDEPDPYFGGQAIGRVFADLAPKCPPYFYGKDFVEAERQIVRPEVIKVLQGEQSVVEGLQKAVEGLKSLL